MEVSIFRNIGMSNKKWFIFGTVVFLLLAGILVIAIFSRKKQSIALPSIFKSTSSQQSNQGNSSQLPDLTSWKLTLPIMSSDDPKQPLEIRQPELATYQLRPWFFLDSQKKGIVFRAAVNAPTTSNSSYPRSELREMTDKGTQEIFWSSTAGTHTLFLDEAITATPKNKPDVVAGQIHGDDSDLLVIRLEGQKLYLTRSKTNLVTLDNDYVLGRRFTVKFVVENGEMKLFYNNNPEPAYVLAKKVKQAYFKVGVYTQSNCQREESAALCSENNYGEVVVYQAKVTHE